MRDKTLSCRFSLTSLVFFDSFQLRERILQIIFFQIHYQMSQMLTQ